MNGIDIDGFISSHKVKLAEEKSRLERNDRKVKGILPSDSIALEKGDKLRKQRQTEYQEYLKKGDTQVGYHAPSTKSVAEIRRNMSRERERELDHNETEPELRKDWESNRGKNYASLKEKKLAEERRYRVNMHGQLPVRHKRRTFDEEEEVAKVRFQNGSRARKDLEYSNWDEEESHLMDWAHNQAYPSASRLPREHDRAQTPPTFDSPRVNTISSKSSLRSISAPNVSGGASIAGISTLGAQEDIHVKRARQLKYAEELREQMREKSSGIQQGRSRERMKGRSGTDGAHRDSGEHSDEPFLHYKSREDSKRSPRHHPPRFSRDDDLSPHHHHEPRDDLSPHHYRAKGGDPSLHHHRQYDSREGDKRKHLPSPPPPRHNQSRFRDRYNYYGEAYGPPPPPPPRFQGYGRWGPPYYPYPPTDAGYQHSSYSDMYFPRYYPGPSDPYGPPPQRPHPSSQYHYDDHDRRGYDYTDDDNPKDGEKPQRSLLKQQSDKEPEFAAFLGLGSSGAKVDKMAYRKDLQRQMKEKKEKETKEKFAKEKYERQKDSEIYDPFGKGGCGAPVRDQFGNLVADLKQMRKINENRLSNTSPLSQRASKDGGKEGSQSPYVEGSPRTTILTYDKLDDENVKKATQDSYRDYLRQQVKEKEDLKRKEKERQKLEEEKDLEQLEKDRKRLKEEYQQELDRQRRKEEEARKKNEDIKQEAEIKRQAAIMQQEQEVLKEVAERKALAENRMSENINYSHAQTRANSPPVPTLRHKMKQFSNPPPPRTPEQVNSRSSSPPVPALRKKHASFKVENRRSHSTIIESSKPNLNTATSQQSQESASSLDPVSADFPYEVTERSYVSARHPPQRAYSPESEQNQLLTQLGAIRMHLQAELANQTSQHQQSDIFEKAKRQKPKIAAPKVQRPLDSATISALNEFNRLKHTDSLQQGKFLEEFPEFPDSASTLEEQQIALLKNQHEELKKAQRTNPRQRGPFRETKALDSPMLLTRTAQISLDSAHPFADGASRLSTSDASLADSPRRTQKHWERVRVPSPGARSKVSINTLEVDNMAARNEERLRRLEAILNGGSSRQDSDGYSLNGNRFLPTTTQGRGTASRQSELSLDCETQHLPAR